MATSDGSHVLSYVGEVFSRALSACWDIELKDQNAAHYGIPMLVVEDGSWRECPVNLVVSMQFEFGSIPIYSRTIFYLSFDYRSMIIQLPLLMYGRDNESNVKKPPVDLCFFGAVKSFKSILSPYLFDNLF